MTKIFNRLVRHPQWSANIYQTWRASSHAVPKESSQLSPKVRSFVEEKAKQCQPKDIHICDGSEAENKLLLDLMQKQGMIEPLPKYDNWYDN